MARLPDLDSLGARPVPVSRRGVASNARAGAVGQALEGFGDNVTRIGKGMLEREDRLAYAAAKSAMLKADIAARQELEADPDFETWGTRYSERMRTAREAAGKLIRSRSDRTLFEADVDVDIERGGAALATAVNARRRESRIALGVEALETLQDVGQDATDDATREATILNAHDLIQGMVDAGDIDAVKGGDLRRGWTENYIVQRAETLQLAGDLDEAAAFIEANSGRLSSVTEIRLRRQATGALEDRDTLIEAESAVHGGFAVEAEEARPTLTGWANPVAATLQQAGFSGQVVAGFLGNFEVEGGHGGALGDSGTASGLAQWRNERRANFRRRFGKEPHQASHAEQAQFVVWEMQNPEAAGMTVAQRDAILAARTPGEAAALIDRHYERSSGAHRTRRQEAAQRYAGGTSQAPQQHNLDDIYARIDARAAELGWTPEKEESVKAQAARLVERDEALLNRQYRTAADEAARAIAALPNGLTDIAQIPANVRSRMDPTDIARLETDIREERRRRSEAAREAAQTRRATELQFMERFEPDRFRRLNPLAEASRLSPSQYNGFMMKYLEANEEQPLDPVGIRGAIGSEIAFQERHGQLSLDDADKVALFDFMEAQLNNIQAAKGRVERADYAAAFQTAMREVPNTGGLFRDRRTYEVLTEVPPEIEAQIRRDWRGPQPPTKGQVISVWMQTYRGREPRR